jgi:alkaline phosphatase D
MKILSSLLVGSLLTSSVLASEQPVSRIAFGSCANEKRPQPIWETILTLKPQLFIFAGDNVYADSAEPEVLKSSYDKLAAVPGFAKMRDTCPILATWDDHDYGLNDGGAEWTGKQSAKDAFMDFFRTPDNSPMRRREGIYDARVFGPEGQRLQVILLDTRWFRGPLQRLSAEEPRSLRAENGRGSGPYLPAPNSNSTMLGEEQWAWLAEQLKVPADLRIIVSSIQVAPIDHGWEKWGNLPAERRRLLELVRDSQARGVIFISGDRHFADISLLPPETDGSPAYALYEVTSSSLNQSGLSREDNRYRVGGGHPFGGPNFGWVTIDWEQEDPPITMEIRNLEGDVEREVRTTLHTLQRCSL